MASYNCSELMSLDNRGDKIAFCVQHSIEITYRNVKYVTVYLNLYKNRFNC